MKRLLAPFVLLILLAASGCPASDESQVPVTECEKAGQQCKIGEGQLGVCMPVEAGSDELACAPQH